MSSKREWPSRLLFEFFKYQIPLFAMAGALLLFIYFTTLPRSLELGILIAACILLVTTPYLSFMILRRKYKLRLKRRIEHKQVRR